MTERTISGMQVPASTAGQQAAAALTTRTVPKKLHPGVVQSVSGSRAMVLIGTEVKAAQISPTAKAVVPLDAVSLEKRAGTWWVVAVDTWHEPPKAVAPSSSTPRAATTPQATSMSSVGGRPTAPRSGIGSTLAQLQVWAENTRAHLLALESWNAQVASSTNALVTASGRQHSALSGTATAVNEARAVLTSTRDATAALRQGALQDRIVKP